HPVAAPPRKLMKSRRRIAFPGFAPRLFRSQLRSSNQEISACEMGVNAQCALQKSRAAHVSDGSITSFRKCDGHFRFTPNSDQRADIDLCRRRANSGSRRTSIRTEFTLLAALLD